MKRIHLYVAGIVVALVPAILGLAGNASFSQSVPVRVPDTVSSDDPTSTPSSRPTNTPSDDDASDVEVDALHGCHSSAFARPDVAS